MTSRNPSGPRGRLRTVLAAVVLAPVLAIAGPGAPGIAQAAQTVGPTVAFAFDVNGNNIETATGDSINCNGNARWSVFSGTSSTDAYVDGTLRCSTGYRISSAEVSIEFKGPSCSTSADVGQVDGVTSAKSFSTDEKVLMSCDVTEVCWTVDHDSHGTFGWTVTDSGCAPIALGTPPPAQQAVSACPAGPGAEPAATPVITWENSWRYGSRYHMVTLRTRWKLPVGTSVNLLVFGGSVASPVNITGKQSGFVGPGGNIVWDYTADGFDWGGQNPYDHWGTVGVQLWATGPWTGPTNNGWTSGAGWDPAVVRKGAANPATAMGGITDPGRCSWYFGAKIASTAGDNLDEPASALNAPLPPTEPETPPVIDEPPAPPSESGCEGFSFTDPTSWAGAGICVLVKLLGSMVSLIKKLVGLLDDVIAAVGEIASKIAGLVADLVGELTGLAKTLFIPDPGSWDIGPLMQSFQSRPPGSIITSMGGLVTSTVSAYSSAGSTCQLFPDVAGQGAITCSDVRDAPGIAALYAVMQVALVSLTAFSAFKLVAGQVKE